MVMAFWPGFYLVCWHASSHNHDHASVRLPASLISHFARHAESTADGFPLSELAASLGQNLRKAISHLFKTVLRLDPAAIQELKGPELWQSIILQSSQEPIAARRNRWLKDGFLHTVLLQLEKICWSKESHAGTAFCFNMKQEVPMLQLPFPDTRNHKCPVQACSSCCLTSADPWCP